MLKFNLFRIPISVHWMFLLLAAFLGGILGAQTAADMQNVFVFMVAAFLSILIHELGHALTGLKMGAPSTQIHLGGMGGVAVFPGASFSRGKSILVTAAGPAASIILAIIFTVIEMYTDPDTLINYPLRARFIAVMIIVNVFWSIFNLCPVMPLDGGQILRDVLGPKHLKTSAIISLVFIVIVAALLFAWTRSFYNLLIMFFLASHNWQILKQQN